MNDFQGVEFVGIDTNTLLENRIGIMAKSLDPKH
jgi:hypothetical protein